MLVQERLQEERALQDPRTAVAAWQRQPSKLDAYHNYFHEAHKHNAETSDLTDGFWRFHGQPRDMNPEHAFYLAKHMVKRPSPQQHLRPRWEP